MINLFRTYNPLNIVWLAVLVLLLRLGYIFNAPDKIPFIFVEHFARPLVPLNYEYYLSPFLNIMLAAVLVFLQALWFNQMVNSYSLLNKPSFLPALLFVVISSLFTPFLVLSAPLICNFLVIGILYRLLALYKTADAKTAAFDLGMLVAIGTMIYLPFIYLFLIIWAGLVVFRPFNWREWVAAIMGFATVFFFLAVYYYLTDKLKVLSKIWLPLGTAFPSHININYYNYLVLIPVAIIAVLCAFKTSQIFFRSYVQIRKSFQLLLVMVLVTGLSFYVKSHFQLDHFILCAVPFAVYFSYYFLYATRRWLYESLFLLLVISIIYFQFNNF